MFHDLLHSYERHQGEHKVWLACLPILALAFAIIALQAWLY